ncbi:serine hydrolase domain-containing protein [Coralloluteibacterium stylophorae]|uniref:Beta-lactamase family protein n=1 Tax=Coralloluteibacterium stylophorae TaxID=1776034 RepID=A0A8J7VSS2_9GAMM|nr:serine hydrolase domain-containing protein [Coralloluteibacterium stylophorae]MBS7457169.1 beta-lactamase family protein [Coralloluteibacterium stylophorae]
MLPAAASPIDPIDAAFAPWNGPVPGCAIGLQHEASPPLYRAYGMANLEQPAPATPDTVFESGSVAKQVTAAAVLQLVEAGVLHLDDDIRRYLPELPDHGATITIDHLLTHTSGLREWGDLVALTGWPRYSRVYSNMDALAMLARQRSLNHPPGTRFSYTNSGYNLLPIIVERATGCSFPDYTREHLFGPLGMAHTTWRDDHLRLVPGRATGYRRGDPGGFIDGSPMEDAYGSGGMLTNVRDLLAWVTALGDARLGAFVTRKLEEPVILVDGTRIGYGRGLMLAEYRGVREIFHNGGTNGYQAWAGRYPDAGLAMAILCNGRTVGPDTQARRIAQLYLPAAPGLRAGAPPPAERAARPGLYASDERYEILKIVEKDGGLGVEGGATLAYLEPGRYMLGSSELVFGDGRVERRRPDGTVAILSRRVPAAPGSAGSSAVAGSYRSDEVGSRLTLRPAGAGLELRFADRPAVAELLLPLFEDAYEGDGMLIEVLRNDAGQVTGVRFRTERVYSLEFERDAG